MTHIESTCHHCIARDNCEDCKEVHGQPTCLDIHCGERVGGPCTSVLQIDLLFCKVKIEALNAQLFAARIARAKVAAMDVADITNHLGHAIEVLGWKNANETWRGIKQGILAEWPE